LVYSCGIGRDRIWQIPSPCSRHDWRMPTHAVRKLLRPSSGWI
jgi:hypothetical protein